MPALANAKHEAVLQALLADPGRVGWRAYKAAYPKSSQRAAESGWSRLLSFAEFAARRDELLGEVISAAVTSAVMDLSEVLAELSKLGRANMQDFIVRGDDTAEVIESLQDLPRQHAAAIQELTIDTYMEGKGEAAREVKRVKLKLHDKKGSLAELRRHFEPQKVEHTGKNGEPIETKDVAPMTELEMARRVAFLFEKVTRQALPAAAKTPSKKG